MLVPYLAMDIHSDNRKRGGASETQLAWQGEESHKTPDQKRPKKSDDGCLNSEDDKEGKSVSKCGISFRVIVVSIEGVCL